MPADLDLNLGIYPYISHPVSALSPRGRNVIGLAGRFVFYYLQHDVAGLTAHPTGMDYFQEARSHQPSQVELI
jgi:hypothetical protein